jgi:hypothetical protein
MIFPRVYRDPWKNHNIARESQAQEIYHDLFASWHGGKLKVNPYLGT